jgi:hypothetical protein
MKKGFSLFILLSLLILGCEKDVFDDGGYYGTGTVTINGEVRSAKLKFIRDDRFCTPDTCINFMVDSFSTDGNLRTSYGIYGIPAKIGRYPLEPSGSSIGSLGQLKLLFSIYVGDGGALAVYGSFEESLKNFVEITHYNRVTGDVEGIFGGRLIQDPIWLTTVMPITDTLVLENGHFKGKIKWE